MDAPATPTHEGDDTTVGVDVVEKSAKEAPAEEAPANEAPANEAPANEAPANEALANEAPAKEPVTETVTAFTEETSSPQEENERKSSAASAAIDDDPPPRRVYTRAQLLSSRKSGNTAMLVPLVARDPPSPESHAEFVSQHVEPGSGGNGGSRRGNRGANNNHPNTYGTGPPRYPHYQQNYGGAIHGGAPPVAGGAFPMYPAAFVHDNYGNADAAVAGRGGVYAQMAGPGGASLQKQYDQGVQNGGGHPSGDASALLGVLRGGFGGSGGVPHSPTFTGQPQPQQATTNSSNSMSGLLEALRSVIPKHANITVVSQQEQQLQQVQQKGPPYRQPTSPIVGSQRGNAVQQRTVPQHVETGGLLPLHGEGRPADYSVVQPFQVLEEHMSVHQRREAAPEWVDAPMPPAIGAQRQRRPEQWSGPRYSGGGGGQQMVNPPPPGSVQQEAAAAASWLAVGGGGVRDPTAAERNRTMGFGQQYRHAEMVNQQHRPYGEYAHGRGDRHSGGSLPFFRGEESVRGFDSTEFFRTAEETIPSLASYNPSQRRTGGNKQSGHQQNRRRGDSGQTFDGKKVMAATVEETTTNSTGSNVVSPAEENCSKGAEEDSSVPC